jgi:ATP-dependent RNA helicase SUPV3L1/SUV3
MTSLLGASGEAVSTVLRSLGYQAERRPAPAKPNGAGPIEAVSRPGAEATPGPDSEASAVESLRPDEAAESVDAVPAPLKREDEEPALTLTEAGPIAAEAIAATAGGTAIAEQPEEPAFIEIWRPGRGPRQRSRPPRQDKARPAKRAEGDASRKRRAGTERTGGRREQRGKPVPAGKRIETKRIDPDSPFAALAALKAELEGRKSE